LQLRNMIGVGNPPETQTWTCKNRKQEETQPKVQISGRASPAFERVAKDWVQRFWHHAPRCCFYQHCMPSLRTVSRSFHLLQVV
jgi:hypothetical protein